MAKTEKPSSKLGISVIALAAFAVCDVFPIYAASNHYQHVPLSLGGMFIGWLSLCLVLLMWLLPVFGLGGKPSEEKALSVARRVKIRIFTISLIAFPLAMTALTYFYVMHQGYSLGF